MYRLYVVEDDPAISEEVKNLGASWGYEVCLCSDFRDVTGEFARLSPHLVLLDITLPFFNGYHWCEAIRKISPVPILFLSSAADNMNAVMAMTLGADDYLAKPFDADLLMAKLSALLRRSYDLSPASRLLSHRGAFLNTENGEMTYEGKKIDLSKNEYRILALLLREKGKTVSREKLMEYLWETDEFVDENTLSVNVNRLRKKLDAAGLSDFITTKFGEGYLVE